MKYLSLTLACGIFLAACSSSEDSPALTAAVPPPQGLDGLWNASSVDDVSGTLPSVQVPAGEMYLGISNSSSNPIDMVFYDKNDTQNCLDKTQDGITFIGNNRYRDHSGEFVTITTNNHSLAMLIADDELTLRVNMDKVTNLVEADLPVCSVQNDDNSSVQNDQSSAGYAARITSYYYNYNH